MSTRPFFGFVIRLHHFYAFYDVEMIAFVLSHLIDMLNRASGFIVLVNLAQYGFVVRSSMSQLITRECPIVSVSFGFIIW